MQVREIMTKAVRTCRPLDTANEAAKAMWEGDCGCVPVVDDAGKVVGVLTDRDVCMAAYTQGKALSAIKVASAMATPALTCRAEDELAAAERTMQKGQVRRLPVVDGEGRLVGILTLNDLVRQAARDRARKTRAVGPEEIAVTVAAICEPRTAAPGTNDQAGATPALVRANRLLAKDANEPEC